MPAAGEHFQRSVGLQRISARLFRVPGSKRPRNLRQQRGREEHEGDRVPDADANAGIETLSDDVGQNIIEGQVQRNLGILRENRGIAEPKKIGRQRRCEAQ